MCVCFFWGGGCTKISIIMSPGGWSSRTPKKRWSIYDFDWIWTVMVCGIWFWQCLEDAEENAAFRRHTEAECRVLTLIGSQFGHSNSKQSDAALPPNPHLYNLVFPLRFALLKWSNYELYCSLMRLESHLDRRRAEVKLIFERSREKQESQSKRNIYLCLSCWTKSVNNGSKLHIIDLDNKRRTEREFINSI